MKLDKKLLNRIADNALLNLSKSEQDEFLSELQDVLNAFSKLKEVDTKNVEPAFLPIETLNQPREDKTRECLTQEQALQNTKHKKDGYFKAPKAF